MFFSVYEAHLNRRMLLYSALCLIVIMVCIGVVLCNYHMSMGKHKGEVTTLEEKLTDWFIYILATGAIIGSVVFGTTIIHETLYDIRNEAYIVWEGDITVYRDGPSKSRWYIPDEDGLKLEGSGLDEGKYTGKIVYGEKTKVVLDYSIGAQGDGSPVS